MRAGVWEFRGREWELIQAVRVGGVQPYTNKFITLSILQCLKLTYRIHLNFELKKFRNN